MGLFFMDIWKITSKGMNFEPTVEMASNKSLGAVADLGAGAKGPWPPPLQDSCPSSEPINFKTT